MRFSVRRLGPGDADAYRDLRFEALVDTPHAFGEAIEEARARPDFFWSELLSGARAFFGVFESDDLVGVANFSPETGVRAQHLGWLYGVYVRASARGTGASNMLISAVIDHAKAAGALQIHLGVGIRNVPAIRLYERFGFITYGTQPRALFVDGHYIDEHLMVRFLDKEDE